MTTRQRQSGITLVVSLIMLIVLTLLVVSAIRFGNINLKISGNVQTEVEAAAATQAAIERMLKDVIAADKIDTIAPQPAMVVSTGGASYTVNVLQPACILTRSIRNQELNAANAADRPCMGADDPQDQVDAQNRQNRSATNCKAQQWEIAASLSDATATGAKVSMKQGIALRVPAEVQCP